MSHIVTIQVKMHDPAAVFAACTRLGLAEPVHGTVELYTAKATGLIVKLPGWHFPVVVDPLAGAVHYDNYRGAWGEQAQLDRFLQAYAVARACQEATKRGLRVNEQTLENGSIKLQIMEGY